MTGLKDIWNAVMDPGGTLIKAGINDPVLAVMESRKGIMQTPTASEVAGGVVSGLAKAMPIPGVGTAISGFVGAGGALAEHANVIKDMSEQNIPGFVHEEYKCPHTGETFNIYIDASASVSDPDDVRVIVEHDQIYNLGTPSLDQELNDGYQRRMAEASLREKVDEVMANAQADVVEMLQRNVTPDEYEQRILEDKFSKDDLIDMVEYTKDIIRETDPEYLDENLASAVQASNEYLERARLDAHVSGDFEDQRRVEVIEAQVEIIERMAETGRIPAENAPVPTVAALGLN